MDEPIAKRLRLPRWGGVVASYLIPGFGQIAEGRLVSGVAWFVGMEIGVVLVIWVAASPQFPDVTAALCLAGLLSIIWICMLVHTYRVSIGLREIDANRPWIGALLSCFIPGLGQLYGGEKAWGGLFIVMTIGSGMLPKALQLVAFYVLQVCSAVRVFRIRRWRENVDRPTVAVFVWTWLVHLVVVLLLVLGIRTFLVHPFKIPTATMEPTLRGIRKLPSGLTSEGDHVFVDKFTYRIHAPKRGDIVVFRTDKIAALVGSSRAAYYMKRIVGLPGERVSLKPPFLYINGQRVTEPPILEAIQNRERGYSGYVLPSTYPPAKYLHDETDSVQLGDDEYFVLGDNSTSSLDSRFWGPLQRRSIVGHVTKIYWPWDRIGVPE